MTSFAAKALVALASIAVVAGLIFANTEDSDRPVTVVPGPRADFQRAIDLPLAQRLETMHRAIGITPEQDSAWRGFVASMTELETLTRTFERRTLSGTHFDEQGERARHALIYGASMNDIEAKLSPAQASVFRRVSSDLATSALCRKLAGR